jgi:hypothetical protein
MIQRIQSLYMLLAVAALFLLNLFLPVWTLDGNSVGLWELLAAKIIWVIADALIIVNIFQYKTRQRQFVLNRLAILLLFGLLGYLLYMFYYELEGIKEFGYGALSPVLAITFLSLANRAIKKDEDLIRSMDRLR